jgi:hypothetical protein
MDVIHGGWRFAITPHAEVQNRKAGFARHFLPLGGSFCRMGLMRSFQKHRFSGHFPSGTAIAGTLIGPRLRGKGSMAMYLALAAAASSALDLLSSLASSKSSPAKSATGAASQNSNPFSVTSGTQASPTAATTTANWGQSGALSSGTWNALLAAQSPSGDAAMKDLFAQIDVNGDGSISKSEFEQRLGAGGTNVAAADDVFAKLDTDGDGSVSINELTSALQTRKSGGSHHAHGGHGGGGGLADALSQSIDGATTATTRNADGSTTTTLTYADGSKVTSTSAASNAGSASAASSYNLIEKLIQSQSQTVSNAVTSSVKI